MDILLWIVLGGLAGWIASLIMKSDQGIVTDVVLGIVGAIIGGFIMSFLGQAGVTGLNIYRLVVAVVGSVVLIALGRMMYRVR